MLPMTKKLILKYDKVSILAYLSKFGKLAKNIPENPHMTTATLVEEKTLLKSHLELGSLRFDTLYDHTMEIDKNLKVENKEISLMLMKSLTSSLLTENQLARE